jgi:hypothetical protein
MASACNTLIAIATVVVVPVIASCSRDNDTIPDRSEPAQIFYDPPKGFPKYPYKRSSREPGRLIETPLRPSQMMARLPSAFLRSIGHPWEPYAKQIWDFASFGFDIDTVAPAAAEKIGDVRNPGHVISIELGGYSRTYRWMAKRKFLKGDRIINDSPTEITKISAGHLDHVFYSLDEAEIDGAPALVSCLKTCEATLTISPDMSEIPSDDHWMQHGYGPDGVALKISFDEAFISRWREIRKKALCFAAGSIPTFEGRGITSISKEKCSAVRKAIAKTMG